MKLAILVFGVTVLHPAVAIAQTSSTVTPSRSAIQMDQTAGIKTGCDYDTCALRLKSVLLGWEIVRGLDGKAVAGLGIRPPDVASLVAGVPEAAAQARIAQKRYARSSAMIWAGAVLSVTGIALHLGSNMNVAGPAVEGIGIVSLLLGSVLHPRDIDLLSKSIWLYNRELKR